MSRLYASIDSDTRKGQLTSRGRVYVDTHTRGWNEGVRVLARADGDEDVFDVYLTGGSNGYRPDVFLGSVRGSEFVLGSRLVYVGPSPETPAHEAT